jgi:hypothetical protein
MVAHAIIPYFAINTGEVEEEHHHFAKNLPSEGKLRDAWQVLPAG